MQENCTSRIYESWYFVKGIFCLISSLLKQGILDKDGVLSFNGTGAMDDGYGDYFDDDNDLKFHMPEWTEYAEAIKKVVISEGITSICSYAFSGCIRMECVEIPSTVHMIGGAAFEDCRELTSVTVPEGGGDCDGWERFLWMRKPDRRVSSVNFRGNMQQCFCILLLTGAYQHSRKCSCDRTVRVIDGDAFYGCTGNTGFHVEGGNKYFSSEDGILFDGKKSKLLQYPCARTGTEYRIPDGVTVVGESAFNNCNGLIQVSIPYSVKKIGTGAFSSCESLKQVNIPSSVTKIGKSAFSGCSALVSAAIPEGVTVLQGSTFRWCESLRDVKLPSSLVSVESGAFENCKELAYIELPEGVGYIGEDAFLFCQSLKELRILSGDCYIFPMMTTIPSSAAIHGYQGSTGQKYAEYYGRLFVNLSTGRETHYIVDNTCLFSFLPTDLAAEPAWSSNLTSCDKEGHFSGYQCIATHYSKSSHKYRELKDLTDKLVSGCRTDREKVSAIVEWMDEHVSYEYGWANVDPYSVFTSLVGNCMSYAALTGYMLYLADIPVATISSADHQWNAAFVDGAWVNVDASIGCLEADPNKMPEIEGISFSSMGLDYIISSGEGIYLAGVGYSLENARTYESITIPDYVVGIYSDVISDVNDGRQDAPLVAKGSSGSYAEQHMSGIYDCIAYDGRSFIAHQSHDYKNGKCSFCGLKEKESVKGQPDADPDIGQDQKAIAVPKVTVLNGNGSQSLKIETIKHAKIRLTSNQKLFNGKKTYTGYTGAKKSLKVYLTKKINSKTKIKIKITRNNYKPLTRHYTFS